MKKVESSRKVILSFADKIASLKGKKRPLTGNPNKMAMLKFLGNI